MQIDYNPDNFVLIFQNSTWLTSTYCFIEVVCEWNLQNATYRCYNNNPTGLKLTVEGNKSPMFLNTGSICEKKKFGSKKDWVKSAIENPFFNNKSYCLYIHDNDVLGYYSFTDKTFTPFANNDIAHIVMYQFFYKMMSLSNKTINWVSTYASRLSHNDMYDESEQVEQLDDDDGAGSDSDSEEEEVVVLQTGPVLDNRKK